MSRTLARLLIAFLMALAIPVQGIAALSAGFCMSMGEHHEQGAPALGHGHDAAAGEHHHPSKDTSRDSEKSSSAAHCPPCVSCCAAAVIAPAFQPVQAEQSASVAFAAIPHSLPGMLPEELDRPPLAL